MAILYHRTDLAALFRNISTSPPGLTRPETPTVAAIRKSLDLP
jgi:hypothetical protein